MSLVPSWARARAAASIAELGTRLARLATKGLPPLSIEDNIKLVYDLSSRDGAGSSDYPRQFSGGGALPALAANNSGVLLTAVAPRTELTGIIVSASPGSGIAVQFNRVGLSGNAQSFILNRGRPTTNRPIPLARCTTTNLVGIPAGGVFMRFAVPTAGSLYVPISVRLGPPDLVGNLYEDIEAWTENVNTSIWVTFIGREFDEP